MRQSLSARFLYTLVALCCCFLSLFPAPTLHATEEYRVGPGDVIEIRVFGEDDLGRTVRVSGDGVVSYPLIGRVTVLNLTALEIADRVTQMLAKDFLVNPQVTVNIQQFISRQVQILGAVKAPGTYNLTGRTTVTALLARAGGISDQGGKTLLLVREGEKPGEFLPPSRIDAYALLNRGDRSQDLEAKGGDVLFVPRANEVYVMGEVTQPGAVLYQEGMTLLQAISKVGAFKPTAAPNRVQIIRRLNGKEEILRIDAKKIQDGLERDQILQPEDLITVPKSYF